MRAGDLLRPAFFGVNRMKTSEAVLALVVVATLASTCRGRDADRSSPIASAPGSPAASTIASELATFRSGMTDRVSLAGPPSRDSLVRLFEQALAQRDTAGLDRLQITREEFAYLY